MVFQVFVVQKKQPEQSLKLAIKIKPKKTKMEDIQKIVQFLSEEYKFDADEAYEKVNKFQETLNISHKKTKTKTEEQTRPKVVLPFCGMVQQNWCQAVRKNYGLYTQCSLPKPKDSLYCKTCAKHAQKNNGVPQNGDVSSSLSVSLSCAGDGNGDGDGICGGGGGGAAREGDARCLPDELEAGGASSSSSSSLLSLTSERT